MHGGFHDQHRWSIPFLFSPRYFAESLPDLVGCGAILHLESEEERGDLRAQLQPYRAPFEAIEPVWRNSSAVLVWEEHLLISPELATVLEDYYTTHYRLFADHLCCYRDGETLFSFHDAFTGGTLEISSDIPEERVAKFCLKVAPRYDHVPPDDRSQA